MDREIQAANKKPFSHWGQDLLLARRLRIWRSLCVVKWHCFTGCSKSRWGKRAAVERCLLFIQQTITGGLYHVLGTYKSD